jgi:hypothetical protein
VPFVITDVVTAPKIPPARNNHPVLPGLVNELQRFVQLVTDQKVS